MPKNKIVKHIVKEAFVIDNFEEKVVRFFSTNVLGEITNMVGFVKLNEEDGE